MLPALTPTQTVSPSDGRRSARPDARYVVAGVPWDGATTNRPGARMGPGEIRRASHMLCDGIHPVYRLSPTAELWVRGPGWLLVTVTTEVVPEQLSHGTVAAIALVLQRHLMAARQRRQRREHVRQLGLDVTVKRRKPFRLQALHILVQRIHEHRERQVPLQLGPGSRKDKVPALLRASRELAE